jgi:methylase of polypeptide subunit release factors
VRGLELRVEPGVLDPAWFFSSEVLVDALAGCVHPADRVLDLGTGTGIGALAAIRAGAGTVIATDIDPVAVACARGNAGRAGAMTRIDVREGDLFLPVAGERFDLVAFNPPWLPSADGGHDRALRLDPAMPERFAEGLADHLAPGGRAVVVLSTTGDEEAWLAPLRARGHAAAPLLRRDRGSEVLTAWELGPA